MHGLANKAIQCFYRDTYGQNAWSELVRGLDVPMVQFEPMLSGDAGHTEEVLAGICRVLGKSREAVLEDLGTYLVSHPNVDALRRLLRFGGETFIDFLHSLDDLPGRARLAVDDLVLPELELRDHGGGTYALICASGGTGFGHVLMGALRTLADDYGTLAFLEHHGESGGDEILSISVVETDFAEGRAFELAAEAG